MRPLSTRITFELILGAVVVVALVLMLRQERRITDYQRHQDADAQTIRQLRETLRQKELQKAAPATEEAAGVNDHGDIVKREAVIERLDRELAQTHSALTELQGQLSNSSDQNAKALASAEERLQKQQADSQAQLDDLEKKLDAAVAASDIARQRTAVLEADNAELKTNTGTASARAAEVVRIIGNIQDLDRRRDVYLTSILRRYRDITGEFHAMSSMLDTSHDPSSGACSGATLGRIQNAVTSAEDDMRQLNELSLRTQKLEKQLLNK